MGLWVIFRAILRPLAALVRKNRLEGDFCCAAWSRPWGAHSAPLAPRKICSANFTRGGVSFYFFRSSRKKSPKFACGKFCGKFAVGELLFWGFLRNSPLAALNARPAKKFRFAKFSWPGSLRRLGFASRQELYLGARYVPISVQNLRFCLFSRKREKRWSTDDCDGSASPRGRRGI